ncbi:MAG: DUF3822 family protein [Flavobacteriaceae bacterium]
MTKTNRINILSHKVLSVQASLNGLSFCILDTIENNILLLHEEHFETQKNPIELEHLIQQKFATTPLLQEEFKKVSVIHHNNISTIVPKALYSETNLIDYLKFNNKIFESDFIATDEISNQNIMSVYVPFVNINNYFFDQFGSFEYFHSSTVLLENLLQQATMTASKLFCNIHSNSFELVYIKNGQLHFYNSFEYTTAEDFIYYTLFTIEQLQLNTETVDFVFLGDIGLDDDLYSMAYQYIRHISFGSRHTQFEVRDPEQKPKYGYNHFCLLNSL